MEKQITKHLPESPGVYIFKTKDKPIYIGKAINLKRRVESYFDLNLQVKTARMVKEAKDLDFIVVNSELEALLLEAKLIKKYQPRYNSVSKDDKHPLYITITKDEFPRVITTRKNGNFGPFPNSKNVYSVLRMIRRIFPYSDHKLGKRRCLYAHLGLCDPCPNEIMQNITLKKKYLKNIRNIKAILSGRIKTVQRNLEKEMQRESREENFEEALKVRDQIQKLDYITKSRIPSEFYLENPNLIEDVRLNELKALKSVLNLKTKPTKIEAYDIAHLAGTSPTASMVTFINGEPEKSLYRHFKIRKAKGGDDYESLREVARRRLKNDWGKPDLIIVDGGVGQVTAFSQIIFHIPIIGIVKNPDRLVVQNTKIRLTRLVLNLVSRIRDEAHRFARRYHHTLISKSLYGDSDSIL